MKRIILRIQEFFDKDELANYINGSWEGKSHNIEGYTRETITNNFRLKFELKLKDSKTIIGNGTIIPLDEDGNEIFKKSINITVEGINFQSSKIINYYTKKSMHAYRGTCVLKGKLDTTDFEEEGNAVGYNEADNKVVVSYVEFRKVKQ